MWWRPYPNAIPAISAFKSRFLVQQNAFYSCKSSKDKNYNFHFKYYTNMILSFPHIQMCHTQYDSQRFKVFSSILWQPPCPVYKEAELKWDLFLKVKLKKLHIFLAKSNFQGHLMAESLFSITGENFKLLTFYLVRKTLFLETALLNPLPINSHLRNPFLPVQVWSLCVKRAEQNELKWQQAEMHAVR